MRNFFTMKTVLSVFLFSLIFSVSSYSQTIPINNKLGKVSYDEVAMTTYEADTSASVLVLWDYRDVKVTFDNLLRLKKTTYRIERIKILKESGKDYVDYSFRLSTTMGRAQNLMRFSAVTYNLVNGKVVESKMPKSSLHRTDEGEGYFQNSFSPIDVKVGSVVEVMYEIDSDIYWDLGTFFFQRSVPVNLAELEVSSPEWLKFRKDSRGYQTVSYVRNSESVSLPSMYGSVSYYIYTDFYRAENLPAMKKEADCYNLSQYMTSVEYIVYAWEYPGNYQYFNTSWEKVDESYMESRIFKNVHASTPFKKEIDEIKSKDATDLEKIEMVRRLIASAVSWNKETRLVPANAADVVKKGTGDSADINALFGSALNYAGYPTDPVLIKTRSSGILNVMVPNDHAFNVFILRIKLPDGQSIFVDASDPCNYYDVLPDEYLSPTARVLSKKGCEWVDLSGKGRSVSQVKVVASLEADGTLKGKVDYEFVNMSALEEKSYVAESKEDDIIDDFEKAASLTVVSHSMTDMDEWSSKCTHQFQFEKTCDVAGSSVFVPVFLEQFHSKADFKNPERVYPVDFPSPETIVYSFALCLPDGYELESIPNPVRITFPPLKALCQMQTIRIDEHNYAVNYVFKRDKTMLLPEEYSDLRSFWEYLCGIYDTVLVVKKPM